MSGRAAGIDGAVRHVPTGARDLGLQTRIRSRLLSAGAFYIVQTRLPAGVHLRTTLINPLTTEADLEDLLEAVRAAAGIPAARSG